jgi:hypothetical protein
MITACNAPNDFSPPTAKTGIVSFTCSKTLSSAASVENAVVGSLREKEGTVK